MTPSDTNLEFLSGSEREKRLKRRLKPAAEYAEGRERVRGQPERIAEDLEQQEKLSELLLALHDEEERLKEQLGGDLDDVANMQQYDTKQWGELKQLFGKGQYSLTVSAGRDGKPEVAAEMTLAEGNVQEKVPLKAQFQESISQKLQKQNGTSNGTPKRRQERKKAA